MGKRVNVLAVTKAPNANCKACSGFGTVHLTAHFAAGPLEFEWPCWECYGPDVRLPLPTTPSLEN